MRAFDMGDVKVRDMNDKDLLEFRTDLECDLISLDVECGDLSLYDFVGEDRNINDVYLDRYYVFGRIYEVNRELTRRGLIEPWMRR